MLDEFQRMFDQSVLAHFLVHVNYNTPRIDSQRNRKKDISFFHSGECET